MESEGVTVTVDSKEGLDIILNCCAKECAVLAVAKSLGVPISIRK